MYQIKEISELTEIPISTLRYYEELELLSPSRTANNYREYSKEDLAWLQFIKRIKATGMSLRDIQTYSELRNQGNETIQIRMDMLEKQESKLLSQIKELEEDVIFIEDKKKIYEKMLADLEN